MSDASHNHAADGPHEGPIKTPKQLILAVFFAFIVPIIAIVLLVSFVAADKQPAAGSDAFAAEAVARRIQPVGHVEVKDLSDPSALKSGEQVFSAQCIACHGTGVAGAPKLGDSAAWAPRLGQGYETLLSHALKGKGAMGPQGGGDFSDLEIGRAVVYMANKGGAKLEEPKLPAAVVAAAPATPAPATAPAPVAATQPAATATTSTAAAPALYAQTCSACHGAGVAGAPKLGDKAAWAPRVGQGVDALTASVVKGKGAMPPKGGSAASDAEIKTVVTYMVNSAK
ncbi:c-type cytochrome [Piscinibacter sp.]|jgi:cytochrome c5|uniref:c-type cytochrome n=1 Tax=Piscinibacter sp. TaxID=1903157 RepID=UPI002F4042CD